MAKLRQIPCIHYICIHECKKGREAEHNGYCQRCDKYYPRAKMKIENKKKKILEKIRMKERY